MRSPFGVMGWRFSFGEGLGNLQPWCSDTCAADRHACSKSSHLTATLVLTPSSQWDVTHILARGHRLSTESTSWPAPKAYLSLSRTFHSVLPSATLERSSLATALPAMVNISGLLTENNQPPARHLSGLGYDASPSRMPRNPNRDDRQSTHTINGLWIRRICVWHFGIA